jgi:hypothetical protein
VQFEKIGQVETIRCGDELEVLAIECRRSIVVILQPRGSIHDVFDASQPTSIPHRLVDQSLRVRDIDLAFSHQIAIHIVNSDGAVIWAADTAKRRSITGGPGTVDIHKLPGRVAHILNELCRRRMALVGSILGEKQYGVSKTAQQRQIQRFLMNVQLRVVNRAMIGLLFVLY